MKKFILLLSISLVILSCIEKEDHSAFYMPGEFEPHEAVWLGWEENDTSMHNVVFDIIRGLSGKVQIKIAADGDSLKNLAKIKLQLAGIDTASIQ
ncbi:MAG TPA: agmatine deiminase family protein, partial [Cyclobacteriaceae bacterium]|nr:agmatine deiminase family protein [Cyclobacteriaceae bacterium]